MTFLPQSLAAYRHRMLAVGMLVLSTLACLGLLVTRWLVTGKHRYSWLIWDLFLAWIPLWLAMAIHVLHARRTKYRRLLLVLGIVWLLFFPNAPYLLTEFGHLGRWRNGPYWCDLILTIMFAWNGLMIGLLSLYAIQQVARDRVGARRGWWLAGGSLALGSYGIALGRFQRFNSWNVVNHPFKLFDGMINQFLNPGNYLTVFATTFLLLGFLSLAYLALWSLVTLNADSTAAR